MLLFPSGVPRVSDRGISRGNANATLSFLCFGCSGLAFFFCGGDRYFFVVLEHYIHQAGLELRST